MNNWLEYDYLIKCDPNIDIFEGLNSNIFNRVEMSPRAVYKISAEENYVPLNFDGDRLAHDTEMTKLNLTKSYFWVDQYVIAFADRAAQLTFDEGLGDQLLRCVHLPRTVESGLRAV